MKRIKIGIIGMGPTGLGAAQHLVDLAEKSQYQKNTFDIHLFDPASELDGAGGQVKSYYDPETKMTSELGAVIVFPSWKSINDLLKRYNIETKPAPFAMQRFTIGGLKAPPLISSRNILAFMFQLNNYRRLCARADYMKFFADGNHNAPDELLVTTSDWADKNNIKLVVEMFQEFYSGCGYGQNIWEQPAIYVVQLMTFDVVMQLVKNAFNLHNTKSIVGGYQQLWKTMAETLGKNENCHFHYSERVEGVTQKYNKHNQSVYEITTPGMSMVVDKVVFTNTPSNIAEIFKTSYEDPGFDLLINTLKQASTTNYQVVIARVSYHNAKQFKRPSTRFFYESYRSRSDQKFAPVLDIMMDAEDGSGRGPNKVNHMLYFYGNKGESDITAETVSAKLKEYGGEVHEVKHVENWDDYHPHFSISALRLDAAKILHNYNLSNGAQIVGAITALGDTEAAVTQGRLAAQRIFCRL